MPENIQKHDIMGGSEIHDEEMNNLWNVVGEGWLEEVYRKEKC